MHSGKAPRAGNALTLIATRGNARARLVWGLPAGATRSGQRRCCASWKEGSLFLRSRASHLTAFAALSMQNRVGSG